MPRKLFLCLFIGASIFAFLLGALRVSAQGGEYKLTIMHTSENHGHWDSFTQTISMGGIARRATLVKQIRAEGGNTLLLDSGDVSQGTLYFVQHRMMEAAQFYNALGYDAVAIGNHEFDLGPRTFAENYVAKAEFAIVSTNLDFSGESLLAGQIPAYIAKTVGGEQIGLLGFTTEDVAFNSSMGLTIRIKPRIESAKAAIAALQQQGVNKIIAISHMGYREDQKLAAAVNDIDVIVSGHTLTLLGDPARLDKALGTPGGPYPTVVKSPNGAPVLIVHAFEFGKLLGRLNVTFDANGVPIKWDGDPILLDNKIADDPSVEALRQKLVEPLTAYRKTVIGKTEVELNGQTNVVRSQESNLGDLIADAMLEATQNDKTQIAILNGGGIRTSIKVGDVTVGDVLSVLPFGNRLVQFDLKGSDLLAALENGVSRVNEGAGRFPQVAGLRFAWDATKPAGQRLTGVQVNTATGLVPLDPNAMYRIVTVDFMANGGDGYDVFKKGINPQGGDVPLDSVVVDYIKARGTVSPKLEGRILQGALPIQAQPAVTGVAQPQPTQVARPPLQPNAVVSGVSTFVWGVLAVLLAIALAAGIVSRRAQK